MDVSAERAFTKRAFLERIKKKMEKKKAVITPIGAPLDAVLVLRVSMEDQKGIPLSRV